MTPVSISINIRYVRDLLTRTNMLGSKPQSNPMCVNTKLSLTSGTLLHDPKVYRSIIGAMQYLTMMRPNIDFAIN